METHLNKVKLAWDFAKKKHEGQFRKFSGIPYFEGHVVKVYEVVKRYTNDIDLLCASLCHDTIEDTDATYEMLVEEFGKRVADIVKELTSDDNLVKEMGKGNYLLDKMSKQSNDALLIKLCDRLCNVSDYPSQSESFRQKYYKETRFIMENLVKLRKFNSLQQKVADEINQVLVDMASKYELKYLERFSNFKNK